MKKSRLIKLAIFALLILLVITSINFYNQHKKAEYKKQIEALKPAAEKILKDTWEHYKNHQDFTGDWWSQKFSHPKMILDDGRPLAFADSLDIDEDGLSDINWSDPTTPFEYIVVSESSSYLMMRALWALDKETFNKIWKWTHDNLQRKNIDYVYYWKDRGHPENGWRTPEELNTARDNLFAWRWTPTIADQDGDGIAEDGVMYYRWQPPESGYDPNFPWRDGWDNASDADCDIALTLIFADKIWGSTSGTENTLNYEQHARDILVDLWDKNTKVFNGTRYFTGGNNVVSIEPGYLSPFSFRVFDDFDTEHDWTQLVESSYDIFKRAAHAPLNTLTIDGVDYPNDPSKVRPRPNLMPDWLDINPDGSITDSSVRNEPEFGSDAFRSLWRMAVDQMWFPEEAKKHTKDTVFASGKYSPVKFFKDKMKNPQKEFKGKNKPYDLTGKLSSLYWHNGDIALFEPNYKPSKTGYRANAGQYGIYLSFLYAAGEYETALKLLHPLITEEQDGASKKEYIIPDDQIKYESPQNIALNTPKDKIDTSDDKGTPFDDKDGWLCQSKEGSYWTLYDQSDWNTQNEYFSNSWAWFGLAAYTGRVKNYYQIDKNTIRQIDKLSLFSNKQLTTEITKKITTEKIYIKAIADTQDPNKRNWVKILVRSNYDKKNPITIKLSETHKNSGVYIGSFQIGLISDNGNAQIAAPINSKISIEPKTPIKTKKKFSVGKVAITKTIEDFNDGSIDDANPMSWWTDSYDPSSKNNPALNENNSGFYIWKDQNKKWNIVIKGGPDSENFSGAIISNGKILTQKGLDLEKTDTLVKETKKITFSFDEANSQDHIIFTASGSKLTFDLKINGLPIKERIYVGTAKQAADTLPLTLQYKDLTGSFSFSPLKEKNKENYYLSIKKNYIGRDYPYLGGVLFDKTAMDWSDTEELQVKMYLKEDPGVIKVDIQDANKETVILNGYNPWDAKKGEGWYIWKSSVKKGSDPNKGNISLKPIRERSWWKSWNFKKQYTSINKAFNLKKVKNIQFSIGIANDQNQSLYFDSIKISKNNVILGKSFPRFIKNIKIFTDHNYQKALKGKINQDVLYVELKGIDGNKWTQDIINVKVTTTDKHPKCKNGLITLKETSSNSGIYRGKLKIDLQTNPQTSTIGASKGSSIAIKPCKIRFWKNFKQKTLEFDINTEIDEFETTYLSKKPSSWWTDSLNVYDGKPEFTPGTDLGYYIWKNKENNTWHIRWSSNGINHKFSGNIFSDNKITIIKKEPTKTQTNIKIKKERFLTFSNKQTMSAGGFDFKSDSSNLRFDIKINGKYFSNLIQIGRFNYKRAYTVPFYLLSNKKTSTFELAQDESIIAKLNGALKVKKVYNKKDYPYIGKWGLSGDQSNFKNKDNLSFKVFLSENIGTIRAEIEDAKGQRVVLHEYNPWNEQKGAGWYKWSSGYENGVAVSQGKIDPIPIKNRAWFKGWDLYNQEMTTANIDLANIRNLLISIGGGVRSNTTSYIDSIYTKKRNIHTSHSSPKKIKNIKMYSSPDYKSNEIVENTEVVSDKIYVELIGKSTNKFEKELIKVKVLTSDIYPGCTDISIPLTETTAQSGIYRGFFSLDLKSNPLTYILGASRGNTVTVKKDNKSKSFKVGKFILKNYIDSFNDGSVKDDSPMSWWTDTINPQSKKVILDNYSDKGIYLYKDYQETWHFIYNPVKENENLKGYIYFDKQFNIKENISFNKNGIYKDKNKIIVDTVEDIYKLNEFTFKTNSKWLKIYFTFNGKPLNKKIYIGDKQKSPYILPFEVKNENKPNYILAVTKNRTVGKYALQINKNYNDKLYPYFGCWGLTGNLSDFRDKESLSFDIYLPEDIGIIQVDIEDINGNSAILNAYNPYDYDKGSGWYSWESNAEGNATEANIIQSAPIKDRTWWKKWNFKKEDHTDQKTFDISQIKVIQISYGGGSKKNSYIIIDNFALNKKNNHFGYNQPLTAETIKAYKDKEYKNEILDIESITQNMLFLQIKGKDGGKLTLDRFETIIRTNDKRSKVPTISITFKETDTNSGLYNGKIKLSLNSVPERKVLGVEKGRDVLMNYKGASVKVNTGEIITTHMIDNFKDRSIKDKTPITWWKDDLIPFASPNITTDILIDSMAKPGAYVWKSKNKWHIRWYAKQKEENFKGIITLLGNGAFTNLSYIYMTSKDIIISNKGSISKKRITKLGISQKNTEKIWNHLINKEIISDNGELSPKTNPHDKNFQLNLSFRLTKYDKKILKLLKRAYRPSIEFNSSVKNGWKGIDFKLTGSIIEVDIKQNNIYKDKQIWVGQKKQEAYHIPFRLGNYKTLGTYSLDLLDSNLETNTSMMTVKKDFIGKIYPYFGLWGLKGKQSTWKDIDEMFMWIYLDKNPGEIKVEIEDIKGEHGILNGYNPWDNKKGPGWYRWTSNQYDNNNVRMGIIDTFPIKTRKSWTAWDDNAENFIDTTRRLNLGEIRNIQIMIDGGNTKDVTFNMDQIGLIESNYRPGDSFPSKVDSFALYNDIHYSKAVPFGSTFKKKVLYLELIGKDSNPNAVDAMFITAKSQNVEPQQIWMVETASDSGIYRGEMALRKTDRVINCTDYNCPSITPFISDTKETVKFINRYGNEIASVNLNVEEINTHEPEDNNYKMLIITGTLALVSIFCIPLLLFLKKKKKNKKQK